MLNAEPLFINHLDDLQLKARIETAALPCYANLLGWWIVHLSMCPGKLDHCKVRGFLLREARKFGTKISDSQEFSYMRFSSSLARHMKSWRYHEQPDSLFFLNFELIGGIMNSVSLPVGRTFAAISLSLACAMPVMAQSTTGTGARTNTGATSTQTVSDTPREKDRDYGWIGLLGLAGLLGLRRKHDDHIATRNTSSTAR